MGIKSKAALIGVATTLLLFASALVADEAGFVRTAQSLLWQNSLLQGLVPLINIGTIEKPFYEGSPLNILAFFASIPVGFIVYGVASYVVLRIRQRST